MISIISIFDIFLLYIVKASILHRQIAGPVLCQRLHSMLRLDISLLNRCVFHFKFLTAPSQAAIYLPAPQSAKVSDNRRTALMQLSFAEICRLILCHPVDSAICRAILIWINQFGIHVIIPAQALAAPVTKIHIFTFHCHMAFRTNRITCFVRENHDLFYWHLQPIASKHPKHSSAGAHFWPY